MQGTPLCESPESLAGLFKPLCEAVGRRRVIFLKEYHWTRRLPAVNIAGQPGSRFIPCSSPWAYLMRRLIELPSGAQFEDYLRTLGSKTREDVRRTRRNFTVKAGGPVKTECYTEPEHADELAAA